jgi:ribosomal-protein-alanine N-acetyltransferase
MFFIESTRLKLIPLTQQLLRLCQVSRPAMEQSLGINISAMQIDPEYQIEIQDALVQFWLPKTREYPKKYQWYTNWEIVDKAANTSVGGIGFVGHADENGIVEMGYMIDQQQQRKGYATEAIRAMVDWAFQDAVVEAVVAKTAPGNFPSQKVLLKNGFVQIAGTETLLAFKKKRR